GLEQKWHSNGADLDPDERKRLNEQWRKANEDKRSEEQKRAAECKAKASQLLSGAADAKPDHPYLTRKHVGVHGRIRQTTDGHLLLPLEDVEGNMQSLQLIAPEKRFHGERDKDFLSGGKVHGCFYTVNDNTSGPLVICEGYATGGSI